MASAQSETPSICGMQWMEPDMYCAPPTTGKLAEENAERRARAARRSKGHSNSEDELETQLVLT